MIGLCVLYNKYIIKNKETFNEGSNDIRDEDSNTPNRYENCNENSNERAKAN